MQQYHRPVQGHDNIAHFRFNSFLIITSKAFSLLLHNELIFSMSYLLWPQDLFQPESQFRRPQFIFKSRNFCSSASPCEYLHRTSFVMLLPTNPVWRTVPGALHNPLCFPSLNNLESFHTLDPILLTHNSIISYEQSE